MAHCRCAIVGCGGRARWHAEAFDLITRGEVVACVDKHGREIARGLVNYPAEEIKQLLGQSSEHIEKILGYVAEPELIHRDNMVVF